MKKQATDRPSRLESQNPAISRQPLYLQFQNILLGEMKTGKLRHQDRLASVSLLADQYELSPGTITKALEILAKEGYLKKSRGRRCFVTERAEELRAMTPQPLESQRLSLPTFSSPFHGRVVELQQFGEMLKQPTTRLITLKGPGGIGKTRLAVELTQYWNKRLQHGALFIPLTSVDSRADVGTAIATAIGFQFAEGETEPQLQQYFREKEMLLVLDNFEHLLSAKGLASNLLATTGRLKICTTSREPLGLYEETIFHVEGLEIPADAKKENIITSPAGALLQACVQKNNPTFTINEHNADAIHRICTLTQGLPLALELTAAAIDEHGCEPMADMIEHNAQKLPLVGETLPDRHRSLGALLSHSWLRLDDEEQRTMRAASIFRGGFTSVAFERASGIAQDVLHRLVAKSFLRRDEHRRYDVHELIRQFASEQLDKHPKEREQYYVQHAAFFCDMLHSMEDKLYTKEDPHSIERMGRDIDNIRLAWKCCVMRNDASLISKAVLALWFYYDASSLNQEAVQTFSTAMDMLHANEANTPSKKDDRTRALALCRVAARQGAAAYGLGHYREAKDKLEMSLALAQADSRDAEEAFILLWLGRIHYKREAYDDAKKSFETSLNRYQQVGLINGIASAMLELARVISQLDRPERTEQMLAEALALFRSGGSPISFTRCIVHVVIIYRRLGKYTEAEEYAKESLEIATELDFPWGVAHSLLLLGGTLYRQKNYDEAWRTTQKAHQHFEELGYPSNIGWSLCQLALIELLRGRCLEASMFCHRSISIFEKDSDHAGLAQAKGIIGCANFKLGDRDNAVKWFKQSVDLSLKIGLDFLALEFVEEWIRVPLSENISPTTCAAILTGLIQHPQSPKYSCENASQLLAELKSQIKPDDYEREIKRGATLSLRDLVNELRAIAC